MQVSHRLPERIACPVHALLEAEPRAGDRTPLDSSARLLEEPELAGWLLDPDWMAPHLDRLREITDSPLVLNRMQQQERREKVLREARAAIFAGEAREIYRRRLEATAYFLYLDERVEPARQALAAHLALSPGSPDPAEEIPFIVALTSRSFGAAEEARKAREREENRTSLIVKPGET
jgi:hypothetical protein